MARGLEARPCALTLAQAASTSRHISADSCREWAAAGMAGSMQTSLLHSLTSRVHDPRGVPLCPAPRHSAAARAHRLGTAVRTEACLSAIHQQEIRSWSSRSWRARYCTGGGWVRWVGGVRWVGVEGVCARVCRGRGWGWGWGLSRQRPGRAIGWKLTTGAAEMPPKRHGKYWAGRGWAG